MSNVTYTGGPIGQYEGPIGEYSGTVIVDSPALTSAIVNQIWPGLGNRQTVISPARNGMNRFTGKICQGWDHVEQSMSTIFATPFHERVLRRWVGSFVPSLLGKNFIARVVLRFYWAIASAIDLWEPDYRIKQVLFMGNSSQNWAPLPLVSAGQLVRLGQAIFRMEGVYRPRAHLGDYTPYQQKQIGLVGRGTGLWDVGPPT